MSERLRIPYSAMLYYQRPPLERRFVVKTELRLKNPTGLIKHLKEEEGKSLFPYEDSVGKTTIGYGRNLTDHGLQDFEAEYLLINDIEECISDIVSVIPEFDRLPAQAQTVCVALRFNVGPRGFRSFRHFIAAIKRSDWQSAELELLGSKAARQLPDRYQRMGKMLRSLAEKKV